ncbi:MAG: DUF4832 domain-containing protein [Ruminococcus sp.]|nr:DUF4832 domain-containing protein [Ruminococcus sp.]
MKNRLLSAFTASAIIAAGLSPMQISPAAAEEGLVDSGISYTELVETIPNPGAGYTKTIWPVCKPGSTPVYSPTGALVLFFIDIGAFSSGANGTKNEDGTYTEGTDYDLDDVFFDSWRQTFENCRKNGCMIALRFRYDANGKENPEPSSFDQVLHHIQQIKDSGLLEEYKDILCFVESGFVGKWGEQHGGKYVTVDYKAKLLAAMLDCVPSPVPVTVRTPDIFAKWAGISRSELADHVPEEGSEALRVGMYDDGYMGSDSDLGTYSDREKETTWLGKQAVTSYFGGEFSGNIDYAKEFPAYLPENAIPEMYKTHLSYINSNIFQHYKDYTFDEKYDIQEADNSAYYGQSVFQFIRDHIGYRFVVRKSELSPEVPQGGIFDLHFSIENTGFANPIPKQTAYFLFEKDGQFMRFASDISPNKWYSAATTDEEIKIHVPGSIPAGKWNVYLKVTEGTNDISQMSMRSVRFANPDIWDSSLGANYMGSINVTEADEHPTSNAFCQADYFDYELDGLKTIRGYNYTVKGQIITDGRVSSPFEWTEDMLLAEKDGCSVYMTADEENLYIMGHQSDKAKAPVYNIRLTRKDGESYWMYFASNGYVYFNHGDNAGAVCKWNGETVEYKIPLELMGLSGGTELKTIRLFLQDSADEWKVLGEIDSPECTVPANFNIYSAMSTVRLTEGKLYKMEVSDMLTGASYQWYKDGEAINGTNGKEFELQSPSQTDVGKYSVTVTSADGVKKSADICDVLEVVPEFEPTYGDADCDGDVKMNDAVLIMQSMSNPDRFDVGGSDSNALTSAGKKNADCFEPGSGITPNDALAVQQYLIKLVFALPVY